MLWTRTFYSNEWKKKQVEQQNGNLVRVGCQRTGAMMRTAETDTEHKGWWNGVLADWAAEPITWQRSWHVWTFTPYKREMKLSYFILGLSADETTHFVTAHPACLSVSDTASLHAVLQNPLLSCTGVCVGGIPSLWGLSWVSSSGSYTIWLITHWWNSLTNLFATRCSCVTWESIWFLSGETQWECQPGGNIFISNCDLWLHSPSFTRCSCIHL